MVENVTDLDLSSTLPLTSDVILDKLFVYLGLCWVVVAVGAFLQFL